MTPVSSRRTLCFALAAGAWALAGCSQPQGRTPETSITGLGRYVKIPGGIQQVQWELLTLPDNNNGVVPGPTDYVVLVAVARMTEAARNALLSSLPPTAPIAPVISHFIRHWMPRDAVAALQRSENVQASTHDARGLLRTSVNQAFAIS